MNLFGMPYWQLVLIVIGGCLLLVAAAWIFGSLFGARGGGDDVSRAKANSRTWGSVTDIPALLLPEPDRRRIGLGRLGKRAVAAPPLRSVMVIAPSGAGKTPRVVVPAVLRHQGPGVVTSVKADVLALTRDHRATLGPVWVFDPSETAGPTARWSPLAQVTTWAAALDVARWLQESSKAGSGSSGVTDAKFWDDNARFFLAPLVYLAARLGRPMGDLATWGAGMNPDLETSIATSLRDIEAKETDTTIALPASAYWSKFTNIRQETKNTIVTTAFTILEGWAHPAVAHAVDVRAGQTGANEEDPLRPVIDLDELLDRNGTLYLVAPASDQDKFTPVFETLVNAIIMNVEHRAHKQAKPIDPPLLLALDEAANIAPLRKLDQVASKSAGEGILCLSVWQDEGQMHRIYGPAGARTVLSNHYARTYLPGIADQETLEALSRQIGTDRVLVRSNSTGSSGSSTSSSWQEYTVATAADLRQMPPNEAVVVAGPYKPIRVTLPGWFEDPELRALVAPEVAAQFDAAFAKPGRKKVKVRA